jgi:molybdenum cofactor cytidylyltransferase
MVGAIVLAAGRSERMGRPKPLLPCRGSTFLGTVLATLARTRVGAVRVVLGHGAEDIRGVVDIPDGGVAINPKPDRGMLSSLRCGIAALPPGVTAFLVWPVDHPLVEAGTVDRLIEALEASGAPLAIPIRAGRRGHPALFSIGLATEIEAAPENEGARAVVRAHAGDLIEVPVNDRGVVTGIDTPEGYAAAFGRPPVGE